MGYLIMGLLGYLLGCSNMAFYLSKIKKVDLRKGGSGNLGASNAMVLMGWKAGIAVGFHDVLKATLAVVLARLLLFPALPHVGAVAGVAAVLGHMFPFYLKFKGGKGLACLVGALIALDWRAFIVGGILIIAITLITDYIFIATCTLAVLYPLFAYFYSDARMGSILISVLLAAITGALIFSKHVINIKRLIAGTEIGLRGANSGKYRKK